MNAYNRRTGAVTRRASASIRAHAQRVDAGVPAMLNHAPVSADLARRALDAFSDVALEDAFHGRNCEFRIFNRVGHARRDIVEFAARSELGTQAYLYRHKQAELRRENAQRFLGTVPRAMASLPILEELAQHIRDTTGDSPNHCILTRYKNAGDGIGGHHDKCLDLQGGSRFYVYSFGGERRFFMLHPYLRDVHYHTRTPNGSLLSVDWEANKIYKHGIDEVGCSDVEKSRTRYSVVFRTSKRLVDVAVPHAIHDAPLAA